MSAPLMIAIMFQLQQNGINPKLCGFDVPVYVGGGADFEVKKKEGKTWSKEKAMMHPLDVQATQVNGLEGSKLVHSNEMKVIAPMSATKGGCADYKNKHKKVMFMNSDGKVSFVLGGWSLCRQTFCRGSALNSCSRPRRDRPVQRRNPCAPEPHCATGSARTGG